MEKILTWLKASGKVGSERSRHGSRNNGRHKAKNGRRVRIDAPIKDKESKEFQRAKRKLNHIDYLPSDEVPEAGEMRTEFCGFVIQSGLGKSYLANKHGWVDVDSLVQTSRRKQLWEDTMTKLSAGETWEKATEQFVSEAANTLRLFEPATNCILMAHDASILRRLGVAVMGGVQCSEPIMRKLLEGRQAHEIALANINRQQNELVLDCPLYDVTTHEDVERYMLIVCSYIDVPTGIPRKYAEETPGYYDPGKVYGHDRVYDINDLIDQEHAGVVPREAVDYQVRLQNRGYYRGYGVTMNDWATVMAKANNTSSIPLPKEQEWANVKPLTLERLTDDSGLAEEKDVQFIIAAQTGARHRFIVNLLVHWKGLGIESSLGNRLLRLYQVPQTSWHSFFKTLAKVVHSTEVFMGYRLTEDERNVLSDLYMLSSYERPAIIRLLGSSDRIIGRPVPSLKMVTTINENIHLVSGKCGNYNVTLSHLDTYLTSIDNQTSIASELASSMRLLKPGSLLSIVNQSRPCSLKEAVCIAFACRVMDDWAGLPGAEAALAVAMHKMYMCWGKLSVIRDEWSDFVGRKMASDRWSDGLVLAGVDWLYCTLAEARCGDDWSVRFHRFLRQVIVASLAAQGGCTEIQISDKGRLELVGVPKDRIWLNLVNCKLPSHMLDWCDDELFDATQLGIYMIHDRGSDTLRIMEVCNAPYWLPLQMSPRDWLSSINWLLEHRGSVEPLLMTSLLGTYFKEVTGHSLTGDRIKRLSIFAHSHADDGGLGIVTIDNMLFRVDKPYNSKSCIWKDNYDGMKPISMDARLWDVRPRHVTRSVAVVDLANNSYATLKKISQPNFDCVDFRRKQHINNSWRMDVRTLGYLSITENLILETCYYTTHIRSRDMLNLVQGLRPLLTRSMEDPLVDIQRAVITGDMDRSQWFGDKTEQIGHLIAASSNPLERW
jgi:hypothetical protein